MAIRRPLDTNVVDITGADLASDIAISTTGNIATTGSGTLTSAGAFTASGGIANAGTITAGTVGSSVVFPAGHIVQVQSKAFLQNQTIYNNVFTEVGTGASGAEGEPLTITMAVGSGNKILFTGQVHAGGNSRYFGIIITKDNTGTYTWGNNTAGPATGSIFHGIDSGNKARILAYLPVNDSITHNSYQQYQANFNFLYTPGDTSSHTYTLKAGSTYVTSAGKITINIDETSANNSHTAKTVSTITACEVVA